MVERHEDLLDALRRERERKPLPDGRDHGHRDEREQHNPRDERDDRPSPQET